MHSKKPLQKIRKKIKSLSSKQKIGAVLMGLMGLTILYNIQHTGLGNLFRADLLQTPAPFDGTVKPVDKVPNWIKWKGDNHTDKYGSISASDLMDLPDYNITELQKPADSLNLSSTKDQAIRNAQLTYAVVYLGSYDMNHVENAGSHLAVDIRMPEGTPVKSIANGKVVKVSMTEDGFGHHVVIEHPNVPDPDNSNQKTTLYSTYNHMSDVDVKEGQIVKKGQTIGKSGETGTATTPHLHFQIDRASAPWHPYWPFTWSESQEAGLSFFEAVNAGLGLENAKQNTINPMPYVQKHTSETVASESEGDTNQGSEDQNNEIDENDDLLQNPVTVPDLPPIQENILSEDEYASLPSDLTTSTENQKSESQDSNNQSNFLSDVPASHPHYKAIKSLVDEGVINGYPDGTFLPDKVVSRVEALKMLMLAFDVKADKSTTLPFSDIDQSAWYSDTLAAAFKKNIVQGYADGTFKPAQIVNKAEYLKMLFETNGVEPTLALQNNPYDDVPKSAWYAGYAYLTNKQNLIDVANNQLKANEGMTRADVAETIYRMKYLLENNMISYAKN